jgi:hypothetical protein
MTGITELQEASTYSIVDRITLKLTVNTMNGNVETVFIGIRMKISGGIIRTRIRVSGRFIRTRIRFSEGFI